MKPVSIPVSELDVPDDGSLPRLSASDIQRLLSIKVRRGQFIAGVLSAAGMAVAIYAITISPSIPWAITGALCALVFGTAFGLARRKLDLARRISLDPGLVYWAHPTVLRQIVGGATIDSTFITLHSRIGGSFEVGMSREEMLAVVSWLRQHNPGIRLGPYDSQA